MKILKYKDLNKRNSYLKEEINNKSCKFVLINSFKTNLTSFQFKQKKRNSKTQIVRRCVLTNRARGSVRLFGVSRIAFRDLLSSGFIPGYKKRV
jgi:ribosomal protein S14